MIKTHSENSLPIVFANIIKSIPIMYIEFLTVKERNNWIKLNTIGWKKKNLIFVHQNNKEQPFIKHGKKQCLTLWIDTIVAIFKI